MDAGATTAIVITMVLALMAFALLYLGAIFGTRRKELAAREIIDELGAAMNAQVHDASQVSVLRDYIGRIGTEFTTELPFLTKQVDEHRFAVYFPTLAGGRGWSGFSVIVQGPKPAATDLSFWGEGALSRLAEDSGGGSEVEGEPLPSYRIFSSDPVRARETVRAPVLMQLLKPEGEPAIGHLTLNEKVLQVRTHYKVEDLSVDEMRHLVERALSLREVLQESGRENISTRSSHIH